MITFNAKGHKNITSKHKNTFEFTKESHLNIEGDCIVGINSNFNLEELQTFAKENNKAIIEITVNKLKETIECQINKDFSDNEEFVVRKSNFISERTFGLYASKGSKDFKEDFVKELQNPDNNIEIKINSSK